MLASRRSTCITFHCRSAHARPFFNGKNVDGKYSNHRIAANHIDYLHSSLQSVVTIPASCTQLCMPFITDFSLCFKTAKEMIVCGKRVVLDDSFSMEADAVAARIKFWRSISALVQKGHIHGGEQKLMDPRVHLHVSQSKAREDHLLGPITHLHVESRIYRPSRCLVHS